MLITSLVAIGLLLIIAAVVLLSDNLIQIEAQKSGLDIEKDNYSIFPQLSDIGGAKVPFKMEKTHFHKLKKGHNIKLVGGASDTVKNLTASRFAVRPQNFRGNAPIPKMMVAVGDEVKAGDPLFYDKLKEEVLYVAPVSGEVVEIKRGQKRSITDVIILADKEQKYAALPSIDLADASRSDLVAYLKKNGAWPLINQRPYDIIADDTIVPRDIFISCFDTAPLAPKGSVLLDGRGAAFQKGINALNKLTEGKVYLSLESGDENDAFVKPIKAGDAVWTLGIQEVITIGNMIANGKYDSSRVIALTGGGISEPQYVRTNIGANIGDLMAGQDLAENQRIIAGDVLSGKTSSADSFLNFTDDQITVIKEGNQFEMFGWLLPLKPRPSVSKTYPGFLMPNHQYEANTNTHGEERAFVVTGGYEKLLPMDIYVQHLMKAIMAGDIERMEGLGINELSEEDIALAEFSDVSKQPLQKILREGLDMLREQG